MLQVWIVLALVLSAVGAPIAACAQQAEAPGYRDGDWWRIKLEVARPGGVSVTGPQLGGFPEYRVQIDSGQARVFGIRGDESRALDAPPILALVLGKSGWRGELLRFPLRVGLTWSDRFQFQPRGAQARWEEAGYEVQAWEKFKSLRGEVDAFKIVMRMNAPTGPRGKGTAVRTGTYYYAPEIKAIVSFADEGGEAALRSSLLEFHVSQ